MANDRNIKFNFQIDVEAKKAKAEIESIIDSLNQVQKVSAGGKLGITEDINKAKDAANIFQKALQDAVNVDTGKLNLNKFNDSITRSKKSFQELANQLRSAGSTGQEAFYNLATAIAQAEIPAKNTNKLLKEMTGTLMNTARWQLSSTLLHGITGAIQGAVNYAKELDDSLTSIQIVTQKSDAEMAKFAESANKAATALSTTTNRYAQASLIYFQQGLDAEEVEKRAAITVKMANVTGQTADIVSQQMTSVWNNFADGSKSLEYFADGMTALGAATATSSSEIAEGLQKFASIGETVGLSYEYAASALATITATTRESADTVGNALKSLFARIEGLNLGETADDGTTLNKYSAALAKVGVDIKDANGNLKDMDQILDELGERWQTLGREQQVALAQTVAGQRQYAQLMTLMNNWDFMKENLQTVASSSGTLQKQADIYAKSWEAASARVRAHLEEIYAKLVDRDFFTQMSNNITIVIDRVSDLIDGLGGVPGILLTIGSVFADKFADKIPTFFNSILQNIDLISGKTKQATLSLQDEMLKYSSSYLSGSPDYDLGHQSRLFGANAEDEAKIHSIQEIGKLQLELNQNAHLLTEEEKKQYEWEIQKGQILYSQLEAEGKRLDSLRDQADAYKDQLANKVKSDDQGSFYEDAEELRDITIKMSQLEDLTKNVKTNIDSWTNGLQSNEVLSEDIVSNAKQYTTSLLESGKISEDTFNKISAILNSDNLTVDGIKKINSILSMEFSQAKGQVAGFKEVISEIYNIPAEEIQKLIDKYKGADKAQTEFTEHGKAVDAGLKSNFTHTVTFGEALGKLTGALSSYGAVISSITRVVDVFSDEDATMVNKITAAVGLLVTTINFASKATSALAAIQGVLNKINIAAVGAEAAHAGAIASLGQLTTALTTKVTALTAAASVNPLFIAGAVIAAGIAAIAIATDQSAKAFKAEQEALKDSVEEHQKLYEEAHKEIEENDKLLTSYETLLEKYKQTHEGKEELMAAADEVANKYQVEGASVLILKGQYEQLTTAIYNKRKASIDDARQDLDISKAKQGQLIENAMRQQNPVSIQYGASKYGFSYDGKEYLGGEDYLFDTELEAKEALNNLWKQIGDLKQALDKATNQEKQEIQKEIDELTALANKLATAGVKPIQGLIELGTERVFDFSDQINNGVSDFNDQAEEAVQTVLDIWAEKDKELNIGISEEGNLQIKVDKDATIEEFMDVYDAVVEFKNQYVATFDDVNDAINTGLYKSLDTWLTQNEAMFQEYQAIIEQYQDLELTPELDRTEQLYIAKLPEGEITNLQEYEGLLKELYGVLEKAGVAEADYDKVLQARFSNYNQYIDLATKLKAVDEIINEEGISDAEKAWRQQAKEYIENSTHPEDLELFAFINFDKIKDEKALEIELNRLREKAEHEDNLIRIQSQMAIVENNKFKSGMTHNELMAFKESSEIDWDSEEAKEVQMSWTEFLYANDKKRKELLDQYYEKLKEKEEESYKDKIRDLAKEQYYAEKNVDDLEAKKQRIRQDPSSTSEDLKEIDDKLLEAKLQKQEADKALEEAQAEYTTIGTSLQEEMALIQQQLATSVLKTGDTLTKKQTEALTKLVGEETFKKFAVTLDDGTSVVVDKAEELGTEASLAYFRGLAEKGQDIDLSEILNLDVANGLLEEGLINDEDYQQVVKILDATGSLKLTLEDLAHEDLLRQALGEDKFEEYKKGISTAEESIDELIEKILSGQVPAENLLSTIQQVLDSKEKGTAEKIDLLTQSFEKGQLAASDFADKTKDYFTSQQQLDYILNTGFVQTGDKEKDVNNAKSLLQYLSSSDLDLSQADQALKDMGDSIQYLGEVSELTYTDMDKLYETSLKLTQADDQDFTLNQNIAQLQQMLDKGYIDMGRYREGIQELVESYGDWGMTAEEVYTRLVDIEVEMYQQNGTLETNAAALGRQCASMENYQTLMKSLKDHSASFETQTKASNAALVKLGSQYDSCKNAVKKLTVAIEENNESMQKAAASELKLGVRAEEAAETYGLEAKQIKTLAKSYQDLGKAGVDAYKAAANNEEIAVDLATRYINLNKGIKDLQSNWEDYEEALSELSQAQYSVEEMNSVFFDHQEALEGVQAALAQVLNLSDPAAISFQFLAQNAELVQRAMEGDTLAIGELQAKMAEDLILHLDVDDSEFLEVLGMSKQEYLDWIYALPEGEIGLSDLEALEKLANLMLKAGYTVEEIESAFAGCGLDLDITPVTQELETVPEVADGAGKSAGQRIIDGLSAAFPAIASVAQKIGEVIADSTATDVQVNNEESTAESTSLYETADVIKQDVPYSVTVPTYQASVSDQGQPVFLTGSQTINGLSYARFTAVPNPTTLKKEDKTNVSAVQITAGNKTVGGKISHVNSSGGNKRTPTPTSSPRTSSPRSSSGGSSTPHVNAPTIKVHDTKYNERKTIDDYQKDKVRKETPNKKETPEEVHTSKKKYYNERYEKDATFEEKEYETKDSSIYKQFDDEIERYHDVSNALENISHKLDEIDQRKSRAFGKAHLDALNDEKNALQEQLKLQEQYVDEMGQRSGELRQRLEQRGYTFDENGSISNYVPQTEQNIIDYNLGKEKAVEQRNKNKERWNKAYSEAYEARNQAYREITDKYNAAMQKETERYNTSVGKADDIRNAADKAAIAKYNKGLEQLAVNTKFNADSAANSEYLATMRKAVNTYNKAITEAETARENALSQAESNRMRDLTDAYNRYIEGGNKDAYDDIVSTIENAYSNAVSLAENVYSNSMDKAADQFDKVKTKADNKLKEANEDNKEAYDLAIAELGSTLSKELADNKRIHEESIDVAQEIFDDNTHQIKEDMQDAQDLVDAQLETATDAADKELERADRIVEIAEEGVENTYETTENMRQEYESLQDEIQNAMLSAQELRNKIYDNALEVIDYTLDLKVRISNEVMAALEAYLSALGDRADKAADRITNLASQMGQFAYQVGETRTAIADLLNSTGNIDQAIIDRLMSGSEASVDDLNALIAGDLFTEGKIAQLEKYRDSLVSLINEQRNLKEQMFSNIESAFNEYQDSLDRQIQRITHLTKITDTYKNIVGIIGKKTLDATGQVSELLARQTFESQRRQTETYKTILDEIDSNIADMKYKQSQYDLDSEMYKDFQEKIDAMEDKRQSAQENWLSSWEAEMQSAADYYANAIDTITMVFETSIAGIIGSLDQLQSEMDRQKQIADVYVEDYEKIYQLNKLNRDIEEAINDSDRVKNKQQLKKLQDQINQASADGVKLSQYDLDVLRKKFELEIARNELEESKNAKSQVRMMRDAEGNYGYVYTADANAVADAEQSYEDKLHELQVLNTEYIKQLEDNYLQLQQNVRDQIANLDITQFATEEEYLAEVDRIQQAALELQDRYGQQMSNAVNNNRDLYENDWAAYSRLTGYKISADEEYLDKFEETQYSILTGFKSIEEAKGVFTQSLVDAVAAALTAYQQTRDMQEIAMQDGETSMSDFAESATKATAEVGAETQNLANEAKDLSVQYRDAFSQIADKAKEFADNYTKNIQPVIDKNLELLNVISQIIEKQAGMNDETSSSTTGGQTSGTTASGMTWTAFQSVGQAIDATSKGFKKYGDYLPYIAALLRIDESNDYGGWGTVDGNIRKARLEEVFGEGAADDIDRYLAKFGADLPTYYSAMINNGTLERYSYERLKRIVKLDTGGYTGEWASNLGKLAFLHEKELVLNKEDTANLLTAVDMIRNIAQVIDLNARSTSQAMSSAFSAGLVQETNRNFEQDVHITAEFPNATDRDEIIAAFDNLTNLAYQLAGQQ